MNSELEFPQFDKFQIVSQKVPLLNITELNSQVLENKTWELLWEVELLWSHCLMLQYKWKVGYILSFESNDIGIKVKQLCRVGKSGFRIWESLDCMGYCLAFLRKNYIEKWIKVWVEELKNIWNDPKFNRRYNQFNKYKILGIHLEHFCKEQWLIK